MTAHTADASGATDVATDYDILDADYIRSPYGVWADLRARCPVAHTERYEGSWMPTRYEDLHAIAHDHERFTSRNVGVMPPPPSGVARVPPIDSDPPEHRRARRLILPVFSPKAVAERDEPFARALCEELIDGFIERGTVDAAVEYAQQIPSRVISHMLGIPEERNDEFVGWVRGVLELGYFDPDLRVRSREALVGFFRETIAERLANPGDDLISQLLQSEVDGVPVQPEEVAATCNLLLIAGIDTTWSSIGSALWHLATHPDDRRRLVAEPALLPTAVEELIRAYSPVTMARIVGEDLEYAGCPMRAGDRVLMNFPAANRDPEVFDRPDEVVIDREHNRHIAFGVGIHRCAGSNQARMEMQVALSTWLRRIPEFELSDPDAVTWAGGQVRGPRNLPMRFPA